MAGGLYSPPHVLINADQHQLSSFLSQIGWKGEVFTLPSIIHLDFHLECMESMLAETTANSLFHGHHGFPVEWSWNGHGMVNSIWNVGISTMDCMEVYGIIHIDDYHSNSYSVLTIFKLNKTFTRSVNWTLDHRKVSSALTNWATKALLYDKLHSPLHHSFPPSITPSLPPPHSPPPPLSTTHSLLHHSPPHFITL